MGNIEDLEGEIWKEIIGFENYQISNLGRIKSLSRYRNSGTGGYFTKERILAKKHNNRNYIITCLYKDNKDYYFLVHRLVATAFISNPENLDTVDHINGDKNNNRVENLRWLSNIDNWSRSCMGEGNGRAKMNTEKVIQLRNLYDEGKCSNSELSKMFNIGKSQINAIVTYKNWKNI